MTSSGRSSRPSRRSILRWSAAATAGLVLDLGFDGVLHAETKRDEAAVFRPSARLSIDRGGNVTLVVGKSEMGQGVRTSLAMVIADELDADWSRVVVVQASPGDDFADLRTSGSGSVMTTWVPLRRLGSAARDMLVRAAAETWGIAASACRAEKGFVVDDARGVRVSYAELVPAAAKIERPRQPKLKDPSQFTLIGKRLPRVDGPAIVGGTARYGIDARVPGMLVATVLRAPVLGAKLAGFDGARAKALPGVRDVVAIPSGVAIVAESTWAALRGRELVETRWEEGPEPTFDSRAMRERLVAGLAGAMHRVRSDGDAAAALAAAPTKLEAVYEYPCQAHAPLEPLNAIADARSDKCEVWSGTQAPNQAQEEIAELLGLPLEAVVVHVALLGGGFGRRLGTDFTSEAALLSRAIGRPVQVVWTRADDMRHGYFYMPSLHALSAGLDARKDLVAWSHRTAAPSLIRGITGRWSDEFAEDEASGAVDLPYGIPAIAIDYADVATPIPLGPWRGIQYVQNVFARECFLDEVAHACGKDPLAFRQELLADAREPNAERARIEVARLRAVIALAAEKSGWGKKLARGRGLGIACCAYSMTYVAHVAEVVVADDGDWRVERVTSAVDCGEIVNPSGVEGTVESAVHFGVSAVRGAITFEKGSVVESSYADYPVVRIVDAPRVDVHFVASRAHPTGLGEPPVPPVAPAVLNAIFAATGKRVRRLPLHASDLV